MLIGSAVAVFAVFGREEGGEILAKTGYRDGVVEDPHVVVPVAVAAAIGVAIEIDITGKVIAALAGVDVGLVELVIAGRSVIKQHDFGGRVAGAGNDLGCFQSRQTADGPFGDVEFGGQGAEAGKCRDVFFGGEIDGVGLELV